MTLLKGVSLPPSLKGSGHSWHDLWIKNNMPRRPLERTAHFPYHVTSRSNNREWFYIPIERVWEIFCLKMRDTAALYGSDFHTLVLMSNHFHLLLSTPFGNLDDVVRHLLTEVSRAIRKESGRQNHVFGTRYKWSILDSPYGVAYVYKYVLRNPVRPGICDSAQDYRYSTLIYPSDRSHPPISEGFSGLWSLVHRRHEERVRWLDMPTPKETEDLIRRGLKRRVFQFSKDNNDQKALRLLKSSYGVEPNLM